MRNRRINVEKIAIPTRQAICNFSDIMLDWSVKNSPGIKNMVSAIRNVVRAITWDTMPCLRERPCLSFKNWALTGSPPRVPKGVMVL